MATDIYKNSILSGSPISELLLKIHATDFFTVIVIDRDDNCLGVVTSGDIRESVFKGIDIKTAVDHIMNKDFSYKDKDTGKIYNLGKKQVRALPVLKNLKLIDIENFKGSKDINIPKALIMAGGFGKRMGQLTKTTPKPMLRLYGQPVLEHNLRMLVSKGITDIYISVYYLSDQIVEYFGDGNKFDCNIKYLRELSPLGTAGALGLLDKMEQNTNILVLNGDLHVDFNLQDAVIYHQANGSVATMFVKKHTIQNPFGVVELNGNKIKGFVEKPIYSSWVNAGIYILSEYAVRRVEPNIKIDMPDLFEDLANNGDICTVFPLFEDWHDIRDAEILDELNGR